MWKNVIFSLVKNNKSMLFSLLVLEYFGCLFTKMPIRFGFMNSSNFSVSEQNYKVLACIS